MKDSIRLKQAQDLLVEHIRSKGMRMTPERMKMLEAVFAFDTPYTADMLKCYLDDIYPVTRQTVYNNLELFFKIGIVLKRPIANGLLEYETCFFNQVHHHLVCKTCGQIFEFRDATIEPFFAKKRYRKFKMTNCSVVVYGQCSRCQVKINRERRKQKMNKAK